MQLARCGSHILRWLMQIGRDPLPEAQANADSSFEPDLWRRHRTSVQRDASRTGTPQLKGEIQDETVWFRLVRTANQGCCGGGKIDVLVEAPGFTASLMIRTNGNRQTVQISSKGDIRGVSITMVKG